MSKQQKQIIIGTRVTDEMAQKLENIRGIYRRITPIRGPELSNSYILEAAINALHDEMLLTYEKHIGQQYEPTVAKPANEPELPIAWEQQVHDTMQAVSDGLNNHAPGVPLPVNPTSQTVNELIDVNPPKAKKQDFPKKAPKTQSNETTN